MKTLHVRIKDKHCKALDALARDVNLVWNYCNDLSHQHTLRTGKFFSAYELQAYTAGATKAGLSINSATVQMVGAELVTRRKQFKKIKLRWRTSFGKRRSPGWIPFRHDAIAYKGGQLRYAGQNFGLWDSYGLADFELGSGSFSQDARGRWYANVTAKQVDPATFVGPMLPARTNSVGIDLGLKDFATFSDESMPTEQASRHYRGLEPKLAIAQRAGKTKRVRSIHAKIANRRKDSAHKLSSRVIKNYGSVFVGNVNASALSKTPLAKSVLDAGWSQFRAMLQYKSDRAAVWFDEVSESFSTQDCSACQTRAGPKGLAGLSVRSWTCPGCGVTHDRDRNAARNIERRGLEWKALKQAAAAEAKAINPAVNKAVHCFRPKTRRITSGVGHGPLAVGIPVRSWRGGCQLQAVGAAATPAKTESVIQSDCSACDKALRWP